MERSAWRQILQADASLTTPRKLSLMPSVLWSRKSFRSRHLSQIYLQYSHTL